VPMIVNHHAFPISSAYMEQWHKWNKNIKKHPFHTSFQPFKVSKRITGIFGKTIPDNFFPELKHNHTLLRHILFRRYKNMNTFIACVGNVRSGKSYFCLKYAELYMKYTKQAFNVANQVSFNILPFLRWSQSCKDSSYVLDEIQLQMSPREWFNIQHKVFNAFCDIQGLRRNILLMPFPNISYIDKHLRFLLNYVVRTISQGKVVWFKVRTRHELGKSWLQRIGTIKFNKPTKHTMNVYEDVKKEFTDKHLAQSINILENYGTPTEKEVLKAEYYKLRNEDLKTKIAIRKNRVDRDQAFGII